MVDKSKYFIHGSLVKPIQGETDLEVYKNVTFYEK